MFLRCCSTLVPVALCLSVIVAVSVVCQASDTTAQTDTHTAWERGRRTDVDLERRREIDTEMQREKESEGQRETGDRERAGERETKGQRETGDKERVGETDVEMRKKETDTLTERPTDTENERRREPVERESARETETGRQGETGERDGLLSLMDHLATGVLALTAQVAFLQNEIVILKAAQSLPVAFSAYMSDEPLVYGVKGSVVPFRGLMVNVGEGYSPTTSTFTAPVSGHYFFILQADCSTHFRSLAINVNEEPTLYADNDRQNGHVSGSGVIILRKGDVVLARFVKGAGFLDAGRESTFSGFLVK